MHGSTNRRPSSDRSTTRRPHRWMSALRTSSGRSPRRCAPSSGPRASISPGSPRCATEVSATTSASRSGRVRPPPRLRRLRARLPASLRSRRCEDSGGVSGVAPPCVRSPPSPRDHALAAPRHPAEHTGDARRLLRRNGRDDRSTGLRPLCARPRLSRHRARRTRRVRLDDDHTTGRYVLHRTAPRNPHRLHEPRGDPMIATIDPVTLEVIRHGIVSIADQIDANMTRTAFSPYIYEYKDYAVGLTGPRGELVAISTGGMP